MPVRLSPEQEIIAPRRLSAGGEAPGNREPSQSADALLLLLFLKAPQLLKAATCVCVSNDDKRWLQVAVTANPQAET